MKEKLKISRLNKISRSGKYRVISIRVKNRTAQTIDQIAQETNCSQSDLINIILEFGIENYKIAESNNMTQTPEK